MMGFFLGWWRARTVRPLLSWVIGVIAYALLPVPQHLVLALIVWLGVALTVTVRRIREAGRSALDTAGRVWDIADRITDAVTERIRHTGPPLTPDYGHAAATGYAPPAPELSGAAVYCPGVLLAAVTAVLAAEGIPTHGGTALGECAQLLTHHGIALLPGAAGPAARPLTGLPAGAARPYRAVPPALLAAAIAAILIADGVLSARLHPVDADVLTADTAALLDALDIVPHPAAEPTQWPVMAHIIAGGR